MAPVSFNAAAARVDNEVTPHATEIAEGALKWQRELDRIHSEYAALQQADDQALDDQRLKITESVQQKRQEHLDTLNKEILEYTRKTRETMDRTLRELQDAKIGSLETEHKWRLKEREDARDMALLNHLKTYRANVGSSILETPPSTSVQPPLGSSSAEMLAKKPLQPPQAAKRLTSTSEPHISRRSEDGGQRSLEDSSGENNSQTTSPARDRSKANTDFDPPRAIKCGVTSSTLPLVQSPGQLTSSSISEETAKGARILRGNDHNTEKRKASSNRDAVEENSPPKRARVISAESLREDQTEIIVNRRAQSNQANPQNRIISFDEVYQGGQAEYKHIIVEFPLESSKFYILRCDAHGVHFGRKPLLGAAKHIRSGQHGNQPKTYSLAVDLVGHLVWDCDRNLMVTNNNAVHKAMREGYLTFNVNRLNKRERLEMGYDTPEVPISTVSANRREKSKKRQAVTKPFSGITNPKPGELYLGYWAKTRRRYVIMILPLNGDMYSLGSRERLLSLGLGDSLTSMGLLTNPPRCIRVNRNTHRILGWARDFQDGGIWETKREFPVLYFDSKKQVGWLPAKHITPFDFEDPKHTSIPDFDSARDRYAELRGYRDYVDLKNTLGVPSYLSNENIVYFAPESTQSQFGTDDESANIEVQALETSGASFQDDDMVDASVVDQDDNDSDSYIESDGDDTAEEESDDDEIMNMNELSDKSPMKQSRGPLSGNPDPTTADSSVVGESTRNVSDHVKDLSDEFAQTNDASSDPRIGGPAPESASTSNGNSSGAVELTPRTAGAEAAVPAKTDGKALVDREDQIDVHNYIDLSHFAQPTLSPSERPLSKHNPQIRAMKEPMVTSPDERPPQDGGRGPGDTAGIVIIKPRGTADTTATLRDIHRQISTHSSIPIGRARRSPIVNLTLHPGHPSVKVTAERMKKAEGGLRSESSITASPKGSDAAFSTSTISLLHGEVSDKQKAMLSNLGPGDPQSRSTATDSHAQSEIATYKQPEPRPISPALTIMAEPGMQRYLMFDIVSYQGGSRRWIRGEDDAHLRLKVEAGRDIAESNPGKLLHITVDPRRIVTMASESLDSLANGSTAVTMIDSTGRIQRLVFETTIRAGRLESGKLQARRFCQWVISVNTAVKYSLSSDRSRTQSLTPSTRDNPITLN